MNARRWFEASGKGRIRGSRLKGSPLSMLAAPLSLLLGLFPQHAAARSFGSVVGLTTVGPGLGLPGPGLLRVAAPNRIDGLEVEELDDGTTLLRLKGTAKPTFNVYRLQDPARLVVDVAGSERGKVVPHVPLDTWACGRVSIDGVSERGAKLVRVVVELKRDSSYIVVPDDNQLVVTVTPREMAPEAYFARKSAGARKAELEAQKKAVAAMERDAKVLDAETRALNDIAARKAAQAEAEAKRAREQAAAAKQAERQAMQAEARAKQAEVEARKTLSEAKTNRSAARSALQKAQDERAKAQAERERAQAERRDAERELQLALADAQAKREAAERAEAEAQRKLGEASKVQAEAQEALTRANKRLEDARTEAERTERAAKQRLAKAEAAARETEKAAAERLARAEARARKAEEAARKAQTEAEAAARKARTEAESADADASRRLAKAEAEAKSKLEDARQAVARARKEADAAERAAARRLAEAKAEAQAAEKAARQTLAHAEAEAARKMKEADAERARAAELMANAERKAADAERQAAAELSQARARAAAMLAEAQDEVAKTKARKLAEAEAEADQKIRAAETEAKAAIEKKLAAAEAEARRKLAQAEKEAEQDAIAQAKRELAKLRERQDAAVATARAKARKEAQAELDRTKARIEADARAEIARAKAQAAKERASAEALRVEAQRALAQAESAMKQAEADKSQAARARAEAEKVLAQARKEAAQAKKRGEVTAEVTRAVADAERARKAAVARQRRAQRDLEKLRTDHASLEAKLEQQRSLAKSLAEKIEARKKRLASLGTEVRKAQASAPKPEPSARKESEKVRAARLAAARDELTVSVLRKEVERLEERARKASAAAQSARGIGKKKARREAEAAAAELREAQQRHEVARARWSKKQAVYERLAVRSAGTQVERKEAEAKARLAELERRIELERKKLSKVEREMVEAKQQLAARAAAASAPAPKSEAKLRGRVADVRFESDEDEERVVLAVEGPVQYDRVSLTPTIQLLRLPGAKMAKQLERSLDASSYDGPVKVITSFVDGEDAKVLVSTRGPSRPRLEEEPGRLVWHFPRANRGGQTEVVSMAGTKVGGFASKAPTANVAPPQGVIGQPVQAPRNRWRGERIDIELQDAPIKDVLLLFSDIGNVNIIAGEGVDGTVTMRLNSVPWDQALDIILRSLGLGAVREGNVIRVATLEALEEERRQAIERANARIQLKPLETRLLPVSYATVQEMIPKVQTVLSPRGTVTPDSRTNTLIIMDVADNIAAAEQLVRQLDTQTPQVLIEARIVEARTNFTRQLGIQWGFDYIASPGTGNPTGLLFPNSVGIGGGATGQPADTRGLILPGAAANPNYAVDLPAPVGTGSGGALGFSFGSINGTFNTNLRLSAAESTGEVRIISAPKIVTLDNSAAQIEQGVQIPISQVSAQGVNTRFVNATLSLQVTPHVTNEGAVLLDVTVQKNEADFVNTGARGDPTILTKQAQSRMLVNDNDTAVIGGIYTRNKAVNFTKVPWLADIPIIGWFFKNKAEADTRSEVLIFLTPKIVNRAGSIGG